MDWNPLSQDLNDGLRHLGNPWYKVELLKWNIALTTQKYSTAILYKVEKVQKDLDDIRLSTLKVAQEERWYLSWQWKHFATNYLLLAWNTKIQAVLWGSLPETVESVRGGQQVSYQRDPHFEKHLFQERLHTAGGWLQEVHIVGGGQLWEDDGSAKLQKEQRLECKWQKSSKIWKKWR